MCKNVVVLSYKPRADVPILIKYKVILVQVISFPAQKGSIPTQTYLRWHRSAHTWRLVALWQCVHRLGVIWTTSGGIKSLYPVTHCFILLKFCSCFQHYSLTTLVFPRCDPAQAPVHYSSVIKTSFSALLPPSGFIAWSEGSSEFTSCPTAPHLIFFSFSFCF